MRPVRYKRMYPAGFFGYTDICQVRFYRYIVVQDNFIYVLKFCNLCLLLFVLLVKGL